MRKNKSYLFGMLAVVSALSLALSVTLAACGGKSGGSSGGTGGTPAAKSASKAPSPETLFKNALESGDEAAIAEAVKAISPEAFAEAVKSAVPEAMERALKFANPEAVKALVKSSASPGGDFAYDLNKEGNGIIIKKYTGSSPALIFPAEIEGYPVVQIGGAGYICEGSLISSVVIPEGVKIIGSSAFSGMRNLRTVVFPASLEKIGSSAFRRIDLREVVFPEGSKLTAIETGAFGECNNLVHVDLSRTVLTSILDGNMEDGVFMKCRNLQTVKLPATLNAVGSAAFGGCSELYTLTIPDTITTIKWELNFIKQNWAFKGDGKLPLATRQKLKDLGYNGEF